jgi:hypothetical protein
VSNPPFPKDALRHRLAVRTTLTNLGSCLLALWPLPAGVAGGLIVGWELSRRGAWFDPISWGIYAVALIAVIGAATFWSAR